MKRLVFLLIVTITIGVVNAQDKVDNTPPFRGSPFVPPMKLLQADSATFFTKADLKKNRPVLMMLFSPTCDHCQHETEDILKNIDKFEKIQIIMVTTMPFSDMKEFYIRYNLANYDNIIVGRDVQYFLPSFYQIRNLPFLAMYNKKAELLDAHEGAMKIDDLLRVFK